MRTVTLELLRHGPSHNQLLSPLTLYLALCENHAAVTFQMPFEHNQFFHRLRALGYHLKEESREFQVRDTAKELGDLLGRIPGLTAELNKEADNQDRLTHLRLIISASELALLPFELALAPNGFPGAGQSLLLQSQLPLCLTREIRRVTDERQPWPREAKILFLAAAPPGVGVVPMESHLLSLRRAIRPWVLHFDRSDEKRRRERVAAHLVFQPRATADSIRTACASGEFTHIHILAHGVAFNDGYDVRYGLALHNQSDPQGKPDIVSGARLATLLRSSQQPDRHGLARPAVVTLASCDSGNVGSVAGAGASIAHALHEAGIPIVIAGQFPLSFAGSVRLVEVLYPGLLWGVDPRVLLDDLRRQLHALVPATHDWASITAYAALPFDFDNQLGEVQIERAMQSINAAIDHADGATVRFFSRGPSRTTPQRPFSDEQNADLLVRAHKKIDDAKERLRRLLDRMPTKQARIYGKLASTEVRQGEIFFAATKIPTFPTSLNIPAIQALRDQGSEGSIRALRQARNYFWDSFRVDQESCGALVQYLSLTLILEKSGRIALPAGPPENNLDVLWSTAHLLSQNDLAGKDEDRRARAHANLLELYLLTEVMPSAPGQPAANRPTAAEARQKAVLHAHDLVAQTGRDSFTVNSTRRQVLRYLEWFSTLAQPLAPLVGPAEQVYEALPEEPQDTWK